MKRVSALAMAVALFVAVAPWPAHAQAQAPPPVPVPGKPMMLADAIAYALQNHPSVQAQSQAVTASEARLGQARAPQEVQITASGSANANTVSSTTGSPTGSDPRIDHSLRLRTTYLLYDGGTLKLAIAQAEQSVTASRFQLDQTRQEIALAVAQAYFATLKARQLVEVRQHSLLRAQQQLALAQASVDAGVAPRADVIKAQAGLAQTQLDMITARSVGERTLATLKGAMGLPVTASLEIVDTQQRPPMDLDRDKAVAEAVANRAEVKKAQADVAAAESALQSAEMKAKVVPTVDARADYVVSPSGLIGWILGVTASIPLGDGGKTQATVAEAKANLAAAKARLEAARLTVSVEAHQAYLALQEAEARHIAASANVAAAQEVLRVSDGRYRAGVGVILEVTDAQVGLLTAELTQVETIYDIQAAIAALRKAAGRPVAGS